MNNSLDNINIENFQSYLGNNNLKRRGVNVVWTAEMIREWQRCESDPIYFASKYIYITTADRGFVPIQLYDYQREIIEKITNCRKVVVVTSRQAGKTTTAVCIILHYVLFNAHKRVALLSNDKAAAIEILERIKNAYEALPKWMQHGIIEWNKGNIELENGSKIIAAASTSTSIRGKTINLLYIDEAAFVENWDEFFRSVYPTISSGDTTKILLTSTPNGLNHFYKTVINAKKKGTKEWNGYEHIEISWERVPGRDEKWKQETLQAINFDYDFFNVEFCCEFAGSSGTLISGSHLKNLVFHEPLMTIDKLKIYEEAKPNHTYMTVVDVSRGKGLDYSAFSVIDITKMPYKQVAVYRDNRITPVDYASIIYHVSHRYNDAYVLIEINDIGEQVSSYLYNEFEYENLLSTESKGRFGKQLCVGFSSESDKGVRTTKSVKNIGCSMLKLLIEQSQLILHDLDTIREISTFSRKGSSYEAEPGCNDDLVMGLVLFAWASNQKLFKDLTDINTIEMLRDHSEKEMAEKLLPIGLIDDGNELATQEIVSVRSDDDFMNMFQ